MFYPTVKFDSLVPQLGVMRQELERAFEAVESGGHRSARGLCPLSMWHDERHVYIEADVPGFGESDLDVQFQDGRLRIRGERTLAEDQSFDHNERAFGTFERSVAVSESIDPTTIEADLANGLLRITLSRKPEAQPVSVSIRNGSDSVRKLSDDSHVV